MMSPRDIDWVRAMKSAGIEDAMGIVKHISGHSEVLDKVEPMQRKDNELVKDALCRMVFTSRSSPRVGLR